MKILANFKLTDIGLLQYSIINCRFCGFVVRGPDQFCPSLILAPKYDLDLSYSNFNGGNHE